jgi:hypothetical protein
MTRPFEVFVLDPNRIPKLDQRMRDLSDPRDDAAHARNKP